jgi:hypothetical protein
MAFKWVEREMPASKSKQHTLEGCPILIQIGIWNNDDANDGSWYLHAPEIFGPRIDVKFYPDTLTLEDVKKAALTEFRTWLHALYDDSNQV